MFGFFLVIWVVLVAPLPSVSLEVSDVFGDFGQDYVVKQDGSYDCFDYATVKISPCDGKGYGFAIHRYWDSDHNWCQARIIKFDETEGSLIEVISDATGGEYKDCYGGCQFSIEFEYTNEQCDIALVVKLLAIDSDNKYYWIQRHYTASSPYNDWDLKLDRTWSSKNRDWGWYYLGSRGVVVCDSARFYYVYPSDDLSEFCLTNGNDLSDSKCFSNEPPLQAGNCYSENGEYFYLGVLYHYYDKDETFYIRKFALDGSDTSALKEYSYTLSEWIYESDIIVVERGWEQEVVAAVRYYNSGNYFHLVRLDTDFNILGDAVGFNDGYESPPELRYRQKDGFLFMNYLDGGYVRQLSLFTLEHSDGYYTGYMYGTVSINPDPSSPKVYGAFTYASKDCDFYFTHSTLSVLHPTVSEPLPDLHFYVNKTEELDFNPDSFTGYSANPAFDDPEYGPFHLKQPSDEFSFVQFDPDTKKFTGTAPPPDTPGVDCRILEKSEVFYMRVYSDDEVFTETSFTVYIHAYIGYSGTPIPTVSYENGKVVDTTINLLDYFYISDAADFDITVVQTNGLPESISLTLNVPERTIHFNGTVPDEVDNCRNPYPINVTFSDAYCSCTTQFVFETTKERPVINLDVVNETTHYLPSQSIPIGSGININVDNSFVEMADGTRTIRYVARLRDGSPLPSWLEFDPDTRMFSGFTPSTGCYDLDIEIVGLNDCGLDRRVYLNLLVTNEPPTFDVSLSNITNQTLNAGDKGSFVFDSRCFKNKDSSVEGSLQFEYRTKVDGRDVSNPKWLSLLYSKENSAIVFDYNVPSVCETYTIEVYGYDTCHLNPPAVSTPFSITMTNKAPLLMNPIEDFIVNGGEYFNISIPPDTFRDPEGFDLAYQALQVVNDNDTESLPFYITFDPDTLSFSGECNTGDNETIHVRLEATDGCSITSTDFDISILYLPSTPLPTPPLTSYTRNAVAILSSSLVISVAIGLGAFGFKTHRREIERNEIVKAAKEPKGKDEHSNALGTLNFETADVAEVSVTISESDGEYVLDNLKKESEESSGQSLAVVSESMDELINDLEEIENDECGRISTL